MATVGDPLMDPGTTLGYWVEPGDPEPVRAGAFGPTALPGSLTRQELVARYADKSGHDVSGMLFCYCFGIYRSPSSSSRSTPATCAGTHETRASPA
jgi:aminoglycoside phosphotransferase (APT) family kinase protein